MVEKTCQMCGKEFYAEANAKKYCSKRCADKARLPKKEPMRNCICAYCGHTFVTPRRKTYCSEECRLYANGRTKPIAKKKKKKVTVSLEQVVALAREAGLTYGSYVQKYNL